MLNGETDYLKILKDELETRFQRNRLYSLRAFSRDLGISPSRLSDALSGRSGFSREAALQVAKRLGFGPDEQDYFATLAEARHSRSVRQREAASAKLESISQAHAVDQEYRQVQLDSFKVISDWHHFAILELTALSDFDSSSNWIAKRLGIHIFEVDQAVERLIRLKLLSKRNGTLSATDAKSATPSGVASEAIRNFHRQILEKAALQLQNQPVESREYSTNVLAIDRRKLPEAKSALKTFRRRFCRDLGESQEKDSVYCLSIQLFELTQPKTPISGALS